MKSMFYGVITLFITICVPGSLYASWCERYAQAAHVAQARRTHGSYQKKLTPQECARISHRLAQARIYAAEQETEALIATIIKQKMDFSEAKKHALFSWGASARQGRRKSMEDAHYAFIDDKDKKGHFFAIYDGHANKAVAHMGRLVADFAAHHMHDYFFEALAKNKSRTQAFRDAFARIEEEIFDDTGNKIGLLMGSTALCMHIQKDHACMAWAGDSRAVVVRGGEIIATTIDHKPNRDDEKARIRLHEGRLQFEAALDGHHTMINEAQYDELRLRRATPRGVWRVDDLAMSRVLGDCILKQRHPGAIIAEPEIVACALQPGDVIVLACDGLWDALTNENVAAVIRDGLRCDQENIGRRYPAKTDTAFDREEGNNTKMTYIARMLRDRAYKMGSRDNISVLVVQYRDEELEVSHTKPEMCTKTSQETQGDDVPAPDYGIRGHYEYSHV